MRRATFGNLPLRRQGVLGRAAQAAQAGDRGPLQCTIVQALGRVEAYGR